MSLVKIMNNNGPRFDPHGISEMDEKTRDSLGLCAMCYRLSVKYDMNTFILRKGSVWRNKKGTKFFVFWRHAWLLLRYWGRISEPDLYRLVCKVHSIKIALRSHIFFERLPSSTTVQYIGPPWQWYFFLYGFHQLYRNNYYLQRWVMLVYRIDYLSIPQSTPTLVLCLILLGRESCITRVKQSFVRK